MTEEQVISAISAGKEKNNVKSNDDYSTLLQARVDKGRQWLKDNYHEGWMNLIRTNDRPLVSNKFDEWVKQRQRWMDLKSQKVYLFSEDEFPDLLLNWYYEYEKQIGNKEIVMQMDNSGEMICLLNHFNPELDPSIRQVEADDVARYRYWTWMFPGSKVTSINKEIKT